MLYSTKKKELFHEYYYQWIRIYKEGAIRDVTLKKYHMTHTWVKKLLPNLRVHELDRVIYQQLINDIVNIGLHFILKNVRPYAAPCSEA